MEAAKALDNEQESYEIYMQAWRVYILSIRKTTELLTAGHTQVTYGDFGWNKQEWHRRMKLLNLDIAKIDEYFDNVIAKGGQPAKNHLYMIADGKDPSPMTYTSREQKIADELAKYEPRIEWDEKGYTVFLRSVPKHLNARLYHGKTLLEALERAQGER
jgi:hypothetical protein